MKRLGVDVGGTFTDLIYVDDEAGRILVHKLPSTPRRPVAGHGRGHQRAHASRPGSTPGELDQVFHGTTIATNIVIEHNGAKVGMITTEGYRDILHIARHKKPINFSQLPGPAVAGVPARPAPLPPDGARAHRQATAQSSSRSTRTRRASRCASSRSGQVEADRRLLPVLVPEPRARAARRRDRPRGVPRGVPLGLLARCSRSTASTSASRPSRSTPTSARRSPRYVAPARGGAARR